LVMWMHFSVFKFPTLRHRVSVFRFFSLFTFKLLKSKN
jgi:hypothetical protein